MAFVIDNSVVMAWCFEDEAGGYCDAVLGLLEQESAIVPGIWPLEVANVLLVGERKKRLSKAESAQFLNLLAGLPIEIEQDVTSRLWTAVLDLARRNNLTSYDASYLDLAMRSGLPLATTDKAIKAACRHEGVEICSAHPSP